MKIVLDALAIVALATFSVPSLSRTTREPSPSPSADKDYAKAPNDQVDPGNVQKIQLVDQIGAVDDIRGKSLARLNAAANGQKLSSKEHLHSDAAGVFRVPMNDAEIDPPICLIKYRLKAGQTWSVEATAAGQKMKVHGSQGPPEEVRVPAGPYRAFPCSLTTMQGPITVGNVLVRRGRGHRQAGRAGSVGLSHA